MPISEIIVETASFDIQKIKNPDIKGHEYQEGEQLDFWNVREYVLWRDGHECQHCHGKSKDNILNVHHIESRKTGGDAPIYKMTIGIGGKRKLNQAPYLVHGFRLFDKVQCKGEVGFIFGRRVSGSFDVRKLDGTKISANISYKKLKLLEKRKTFLMQSVKASEIPLQQKDNEEGGNSHIRLAAGW